jgi:hypothetical protein
MAGRRVIVGLVAAGLLGLAGLYHARGARQLLAPDGSGGHDVHLRWQEQQYVIRGQNPYDVTYANMRDYEGRPVGRPPADPARNSAAADDVGVPDSGGYPPWAFLFGYAAFWPPRDHVTVYFLGLSLLMTAATAAWAYRTVRPFGAGPEAGWLGAAAVLAVSAHSSCLHVGQYTAVVVGLLALSAWALAAGREVAGGVLMGMALLKPTIAGPFALVLLVTGRWRALAGCVGYLAAASAFVWWRTGTSTVEMLQQMLGGGTEFVHDSPGPVGVLLRLGLSPKLVTPVLAVAVLVPGFLALVWFRRRPLVDLFAVAAVTGRLWAYHQVYDNVMMAFLLVALARAAVAGRPAAAAAFLVAGLAAWAPGSLMGYPPAVTDGTKGWNPGPFLKTDGLVMLQLAAWVGALAALLAAPPPAPASPTPPERVAP